MLRRDIFAHIVVVGGGLILSGAAVSGGFHWLGLAALVLPLLAIVNLLYWKWPVFPYDCILSARSEDGLHWVRDDVLRLDVGGKNNSCQVYYPDTVAVEGGLRMYYRGGSNNSVILSAFSEDGQTWREEQGQRLGGLPGLQRLVSSEMVALVNGFRLYFAAYDGISWRIFYSDSVDGLRWGEVTCCLDAGPNSDLPNVHGPSVVIDEGLYRMYFLRFSTTDSQFYTSTSIDGRAWSAMERCTGCRGTDASFVRDPNVVPLAEGGWRMYFSEMPAASALDSCIVSAVSEDGLTWSREEGYRLEAGGVYDGQGVFCPEVVKDGDGWRMYYGGYWKKHWLAPYTIFCHRSNT